jgi:hypothetical protein
MNALGFYCSCDMHGVMLFLGLLCSSNHALLIIPLELWNKNRLGDAGALRPESEGCGNEEESREEIQFDLLSGTSDPV